MNYKLNTMTHFHYDLANLDIDTLDSYERFQFNNNICYFNKIESLEMIILDVNKEFAQLSLNLKDIAEKYL